MAQIYVHPHCFATPIVQGNLRGRYPKNIAILRAARWELRVKPACEQQRLEELRLKIHAAKIIVQSWESDLLAARSVAAEGAQS